MQRTIITVLVLIVLGGVYYLVRDTKSLPLADTSPVTQEVSQNNSTSTPSAVLKARAKLASSLKISESDIAIEEVKEMEWPDACLGIAVADTMCAQMITPGYSVEFHAQGKEYVFRTNTEGTVITQEK